MVLLCGFPLVSAVCDDVGTAHLSPKCCWRGHGGRLVVASWRWRGRGKLTLFWTGKSGLHLKCTACSRTATVGYTRRAWRPTRARSTVYSNHLWGNKSAFQRLSRKEKRGSCTRSPFFGAQWLPTSVYCNRRPIIADNVKSCANLLKRTDTTTSILPQHISMEMHEIYCHW